MPSFPGFGVDQPEVYKMKSYKTEVMLDLLRRMQTVTGVRAIAPEALLHAQKTTHANPTPTPPKPLKLEIQSATSR